MTQPGQSDIVEVRIVEVRRAVTVELDLDDCGLTDEGINFIPDGGDGYTLTPAQAREIAKALDEAADESEASAR